jgi:uncharacterized protein (DUF1330 family)
VPTSGWTASAGFGILAAHRASNIGGRMTVYAVAQLRFTDRAAYDRYQAAFMGVFARFSGRLLAADEQPRVVEGQWDCEKIVIMSFPDEPAFRSWAESPEYRAISRDREAGADTVVLLVQGIPAQPI